MNDKTANPLPAIMAEIERYNAAPPPDDGAAVGQKWLPPEFYDHLQQAAERHNRPTAGLLPPPPPTSLWRRPLAFLRQKLGEAAIFYLSRLAQQQTPVNKHLAAALIHLANELEEESSIDSADFAD